MSIPYKSFCWAIGTTSFRTKNFNKTIEEQLALLKDFWENVATDTEEWSANIEVQTKYYDYMHSKGFVEGTADNKPKDAREKTSGLVDIGLLGENRRLTEAGLALHSISSANDFDSDNYFQIPKDSYIYLKQMLKSYNKVENDTVRPFIVLLYVLSRVGELSIDEFTYLLPLCTNKTNTEEIISNINSCRTGNSTIDSVIINRLLSMSNYQEAMNLFLTSEIKKDLFCEIGMNRKSRKYDEPYYNLYIALHKACFEKSEEAILAVYDATKDIKIKKLWRQYLFNTSVRTLIKKDPKKYKRSTIFDNQTTEEDFKKAFFKVMHLLKAKATLSDYLDLNRRYIRTTDTVLFEDDIIKLDIIPKHFFNSIIDKLYEDAFSPSRCLCDDCPLNEIASCLVVNENIIISGINDEFGTSITTIEEASNLIEETRLRRFEHLIDTKFTDETIVSLLGMFEARIDENIKSLVTDNADVPTIFEYVLAIIWYKLSERKGRILDYMKLSLDADLLPKTHAAGGEADIVYWYEATEAFSAHTLLLEATLADGSNQRRMEMEPVSRHLGTHRLQNQDQTSYCIFVSPYLDINVISDFVNRKSFYYYNARNYNEYVKGLKIIPLSTFDLKNIINSNKKYSELYTIFEKAYDTDLPPHEWYKNMISIPLMN